MGEKEREGEREVRRGKVKREKGKMKTSRYREREEGEK